MLRGVEIPDAPLLVQGEERYWPWHTGIYLGGGQVLNSHPGLGVVQMPLEEISWDTLLATRWAPGGSQPPEGSTAPERHVGASR